MKEKLGKESVAMGTMRIHKSDFDFIQKISSKIFWGNHAKAVRFMIKFSKDNINEFEKFIEEQRKKT